MKLDRLKLTNADPLKVATAAYAIIGALQNYTPEERALASACHLHLTAGHTQSTPQDLMTPADNLMSSPEGQYRRDEFRAARDYMENERT